MGANNSVKGCEDHIIIRVYGKITDAINLGTLCIHLASREHRDALCRKATVKSASNHTVNHITLGATSVW